MFEENEISINANGGTELSKRKLASVLDPSLLENFQIISSRVRDLDEEKIRVLWLHDLPVDNQDLKNVNYRNNFHKLVFVSNWQMNTFHASLGIPFDNKIAVIENPIDVFEDPRPHKSKDQINLVYFSTPHRGLDILVPVFTELAKDNPNIHLHVYSSFKIYGWEQQDIHFETLFNEIKSHPQMTYHGSVPYDQLRQDLLKMDILAYPNTWQETSCRVLMESMSAGLLCVHPNLAALAETSAGLTNMYQYLDDRNMHASEFYGTLQHAISIVKTQEFTNYSMFVKSYADMKYSTEVVSNKWNYLLNELNSSYPPENRGYPKKLFSYSSG